LVIALNVLLDWLLIFGIGPFPSLGVRGAAIATSVSRLVGTILIFGFLARSALSGSISHFRVHWGWFGRILKIGWPAALQNLLWTTAFAGFIRVLACLPRATSAQAALTVAGAIEAVAFMPGIAYSIAATPLVGQNLGAGKPKRAEHSAWVATAQAAAIMSLVAVLFVTIPRQLALLFTDKASVVPLIVSYLRINAISEPFLAIGMVMRGALQGAGETRIPAWVAFITNWAVRLPLAWLLAIYLGYGAPGAWIAMCVTTILSGLILIGWFVWGNWRNLEV
jgi:putative MATE family efflux protein